MNGKVFTSKLMMYWSLESNYKKIVDLKIKLYMIENDPDKISLNKRLEENQIFLKIIKYCVYQERSELDVVEKLKKYRLTEEEIDQFISRLKAEKYIDNQRFARIYASGKFRNNKWGRIRIRHELKRKSIQAENIDQALAAIDKNEYSQMIIELIRRKKRAIHKNDPFILRNKISQYLCSKGFEKDLVWDLLKSEIK